MGSHLGLRRNANSCRQNALGLGRTVHSQIVEFQYKAPQFLGSLFFSVCKNTLLYPDKPSSITKSRISSLES